MKLGLDLAGFGKDLKHLGRIKKDFGRILGIFGIFKGEKSFSHRFQAAEHISLCFCKFVKIKFRFWTLSRALEVNIELAAKDTPLKT